MVENMDKVLDDALEGLAREARAATPLPGADLSARVLADAAAVSVQNAPVEAAMPEVADTTGSRQGIFDALFGWASGAVAAVAVCMSLGVAVGMELDPSDLPMLQGETEIETLDPMTEASDTLFGPDGFL